MTNNEFITVATERLDRCRQTLALKADEYASDTDRLANFKRAAALQEITPVKALGGMLAKHVIALYDFIIREESNMARWDEKITDTINYCILLDALLAERNCND